MTWYKECTKQNLYYAVLGLLIKANNPSQIIDVEQTLDAIPESMDFHILTEVLQEVVYQIGELNDYQNEIVQRITEMIHGRNEYQQKQVEPIEPIEPIEPVADALPPDQISGQEQQII